MKKWNRRTRVVVLSVILALIFLAIYAAGVSCAERRSDADAEKR